ncbi:copper resistance CopC family protein [Humidisolicoccus flavus]|uniref:copper resistance CopC family protein n=1 Tax=Humidisolicoccus flavus TaxID=3111414 RepID=UPI003247C95A
MTAPHASVVAAERAQRSVLTVWRAFATALIVAALVFFSGAAANAHDEIIGSNPEPNETVLEVPESITLEYSAEILELGALVDVVDPSGTVWSEGEPTVAGTVLTQVVNPEMPNGTYEIQWKVVSSDGHPIEGVVPFVLAAAVPEEEPTMTTMAEPSEEPSASAEPTVSTEPSDDTVTGEAESSGIAPSVIAAIVAGLAVLAIGAIIIRTIRRTRDNNNGTGGADRK